MSGPRHLWSGDWQLESSAHAEDLAARRGRGDEPAEPEPAPPEPRPQRPRRRVRPPSRVVLLAAALILLVVGAAYAVTSNQPGGKSQQQASINQAEPWLGVKFANVGIRGAMVGSVIPGSPAARAGIRPGDVITQLDTEPIVAPAIFTSAISGMQPGDAVDLQLQRGASQYSVHVTLASRPAGSSPAGSTA